ncbi:MAG: 50S ribosomal protein L4 [Ignisphaera sp.]|uniref:Large ribosomal subunit protein uL4 n=1 Tax=Ignisphaera aggregans TaxID=334771 RepID=A0A7J3MX07_9CREN
MDRLWIVYPAEKKYGTLVDIDGNIVDKIELPLVFSLPVRIDVIRRAVHSALTAKLQPKGRDPLAGKRRVGESWGIGYSVARVPRLDNGRAVFAPNVRGGRRQFAPTVMERIHEEINRKEMKLAIMSSLAGLADPKFVFKRSYVVPKSVENIPIVVVNSIEDISATKDLKKFLVRLGLWGNIERAQEMTRIRAGRGKMRGRRYVEPKSLLFIISSSKAPLTRAIRNLPGSDYVTPMTLNILKLAPGGLPGRLSIITVKALEMISHLFPVEKA